MRGEGRVITPDWVATDWCESVYLPAVVAIRQDGLAGQCPEATEADRFSASRSVAGSSPGTGRLWPSTAAPAAAAPRSDVVASHNLLR